MKPPRHCIPLTSDERTFVSAVLAAAIERGAVDVTAAAAVIAHTPLRAGGLIDIVLDDRDRESVRGILKDRFEAEFGPVVRLETVNHTMLAQTIWMFGEYRIDRKTVLCEVDRVGNNIVSRMSFWDRSALEKALFERCYYVAPADPAEHTRKHEKLALFFRCCETVGLGALRADPKIRGGKLRTHIDWHDTMWTAPAQRRAPLEDAPKPLGDADHEALHYLADTTPS